MEPTPASPQPLRILLLTAPGLVGGLESVVLGLTAGLRRRGNDVWLACTVLPGMGPPPLAVMAAYTPACVSMFPRPLITLFAVLAFGPWLGFAYGITGILLAAAATYAVGARMPETTVKRLAGEKLNGVTDVLRRRGLGSARCARESRHSTACPRRRARD